MAPLVEQTGELALRDRSRQTERRRTRSHPHPRLLTVGEEVVLDRELVLVVLPAPQGHRDQPVHREPAPR